MDRMRAKEMDQLAIPHATPPSLTPPHPRAPTTESSCLLRLLLERACPPAPLARAVSSTSIDLPASRLPLPPMSSEPVSKSARLEGGPLVRTRSVSPVACSESASSQASLDQPPQQHASTSPPLRSLKHIVASDSFIRASSLPVQVPPPFAAASPVSASGALSTKRKRSQDEAVDQLTSESLDDPMDEYDLLSSSPCIEAVGSQSASELISSTPELVNRPLALSHESASGSAAAEASESPSLSMVFADGVVSVSAAPGSSASPSAPNPQLLAVGQHPNQRLLDTILGGLAQANAQANALQQHQATLLDTQPTGLLSPAASIPGHRFALHGSTAPTPSTASIGMGGGIAPPKLPPRPLWLQEKIKATSNAAPRARLLGPGFDEPTQLVTSGLMSGEAHTTYAAGAVAQQQPHAHTAIHTDYFERAAAAASLESSPMSIADSPICVGSPGEMGEGSSCASSPLASRPRAFSGASCTSICSSASVSSSSSSLFSPSTSAAHTAFAHLSFPTSSSSSAAAADSTSHSPRSVSGSGPSSAMASADDPDSMDIHESLDEVPGVTALLPCPARQSMASIDERGDGAPSPASLPPFAFDSSRKKVDIEARPPSGASEIPAPYEEEFELV